MTPHTSPLQWFGQFGVDEQVIGRVLAEATAHGADDADLYFEHTTSTAIGLSDGAVNRAHTGVDLGLGVRVVVGDQVGYAFTEELSRDSMLRAARTASTIARTGKGAVPVGIRALELPDFYPVERFWDDVALSVRVPLVR